MCPWCRADLQVTAFDGSAPGGDVTDGLLSCACGRHFPVVNGIPRILENAFALFPDFVHHHRDKLPALPDVPVLRAREAEAIRRTRESFGYQWTQFSEMVIDFRDNFLKYIEPLDEAFFPGKIGLDLGCGCVPYGNLLHGVKAMGGGKDRCYLIFPKLHNIVHNFCIVRGIVGVRRYVALCLLDEFFRGHLQLLVGALHRHHLFLKLRVFCWRLHKGR